MHQELSRLMTKLLQNSSGKWRARIGSIGLWLAAVLLLIAIQLESNFSALLNRSNNGDTKNEYLVVNRQLSNATLNKASLEEDEIEQLRDLPEVTAVGTIQPAYFRALLSVSNDQFPFQTDASFESVPANFIDQLPDKWEWKEGDDFVPVILPMLFLDLYNFQFALGQQLPQLSPEIIQMLNFNITITNSSPAIVLKGRIVGTSDRIQSLLVPESFMKWANQRYAVEAKRKPSRVIIKTNDASSPALNHFLQKNQLRTDREKTRFSQYRQIVNWIVGITGLSGLLLFLFALLVLSLFIQLNITGRRDEIRLLLQLGIAPHQLYRFLVNKFFLIQIILVTTAVVFVSLIQWILHLWLKTQSLALPPLISLYTLTAAFILLFAIGVMNRNAIRNNIQSG